MFHCLQEPLVRKVEPLGSGTFIGPEKKNRGKDGKGERDVLGGGFKHFLFSSLPGEMIQFD